MNPYVYTCQGSDVCFMNHFAGGYFQYGCGTASTLATTVQTSANGASTALSISTVDVSLTESPSSLTAPTTIGSFASTETRSLSQTSFQSTSTTPSSAISSTSSSTSSRTSSRTTSSKTRSSSSTNTPSSTTTLPAPTTTDNSESANQSQTGAIIGGVVGGAAAAISLVALVFFCLRRRNRNYRTGQRRRRSGRFSGPKTQRHQDPLGLLQVAADLKATGWKALEVLSSLGLVGLAFWLSRHGWPTRAVGLIDEWIGF
ncbi:hypothetical protein NUW58_g10194 [Xylaria curta]|uniref:Uncharacterized protein n=1 Tax=Xylaria curta TaxID=42375 RepID=A0ACC1MPG5_9PEZI|nr:hypothetical protein NUW58_g10194 [Xylaria curta]